MDPNHQTISSYQDRLSFIFEKPLGFPPIIAHAVEDNMTRMKRYPAGWKFEIGLMLNVLNTLSYFFVIITIFHYCEKMKNYKIKGLFGQSFARAHPKRLFNPFRVGAVMGYRTQGDYPWGYPHLFYYFGIVGLRNAVEQFLCDGKSSLMNFK